LGNGGELAVEEQVGDFIKGTMFGEITNSVTAITEAPFDGTNRRFPCDDPFESR